MKKVAIIGANGFLGSNLVNFLNKKAITTYPIVNINKQNLDSRLQTYTLEDLFSWSKDKLDSIVLAAGSFKDSNEQLVELHYKLVLRIKKHFPTIKLIYISSTNIYGNNTSEIELNSVPNITSAYANAKLGGELIASTFENYSIIRFTYLYGPKLSNGSFIPYIITNALENKKINLYGDGKRIQDYLFIDDAVALCHKAIISSDNEILLGVSGERISNNTVANILTKNIKNCTLEYVDKLETGLNFTFKRGENNLNWNPQVSFEEGLLKTLESYR